MIAGMDALAETELHEAMAGLGNWHKVDEKKMQYLVNKDECMNCLKDLLIALKQDTRESGNLVHLKLGEWKVLPEHLVPLFAAYREDREMSTTVLKVLMHLTNHVEVNPMQKSTLLRYLQDYKEAFVKKDVFIILMGMLVESMEDEEETQQRGDGERNDVFEEVLTLLCNLMSLPDPRPGDAGFTPMRQSLQLSYIRHFHDEGVLDFFLLFAEQLEADRNAEQVWALLEILYHIVAQLDPEIIMQTRNDKKKSVLKDLLERDQAHARITRSQGSRHSRFGTTMQKRDALGGVSNSASMGDNAAVSKGTKVWGRDFKNRLGSEKKMNMFHDPFFVDLEEGSVRDHNQINPHVRQSLEMAHDLGKDVLGGIRKFFEEFVQNSFSNLVSFARGTVLQSRPGAGGETASSRPYARQHLLNFIAWVLEFHRHHHAAVCAKAKENNEPAPAMDIASIQGAIDLDMIQFVSGRLREYGKQASIHSSFLVLVLRATTQIVKTVGIVMESKDPETRDCGEVLTQNLVKEDVMGQLCWIMKNYKSSSHDPRVLSYTVEIFHLLSRLMKKLTERHGASKVEFHVERQFGCQLRRAITTVDGEIESLGDANVVENLFHLLEKYKRHSQALNSMLVKLIYAIIRAQPANIVVFFELSYFVRMHRMWSDPLIQDRRQGKRYQEMIDLLRFILRQFFKCAEKNKCVFVELLFRKTFEKAKDQVMESRQSEFEAILDNYDDEGYAQFLERMKGGVSFDAMRARQRQLQDGSLPWTEEEDKVLRERYPVFMDHPLCMELICAELPEDSRRTPKGVKKRLADLNLLATKASRAAARDAEDAAFAEAGGPPPKKLKFSDGDSAKGADDDFDMDMPMFQDEDMDTLEMDLEKLLDAEEMRRSDDTVPDKSFASASEPSKAASSGVAKTAVDPEGETQPGLGCDLEFELEAMLDESGSFPPDASPAAPRQSTASGAAPEANSLEADLEALLEESQTAAPSLATGAAPEANSLELDLEALLEDSLTQGSQVESPAVGAAQSPGEPAAAAAPATAADADAQSGDDERFWEEAIQGEEKDGTAASPQQGSAPEGLCAASQASQGLLSQESTLEMALEKMMDESLA
jgi:hypothetical protein